MHRLVKQHYARTNRRNHESQIIALDVLQRVHERMSAELLNAEAATHDEVQDADEVVKPNVDALAAPYHMAQEQAHPINIYEWLEDTDRRRDVAYSVRAYTTLVLARAHIYKHFTRTSSVNSKHTFSHANSRKHPSQMNPDMSISHRNWTTASSCAIRESTSTPRSDSTIRLMILSVRRIR